MIFIPTFPSAFLTRPNLGVQKLAIHLLEEAQLEHGLPLNREATARER